MVDIANARYISWDEVDDVEFDDWLSFLEPHRAARKANGINRETVTISVGIEPETRHGFFAHCDNGQMARVSRAFIRELPPKFDF